MATRALACLVVTCSIVALVISEHYPALSSTEARSFVAATSGAWGSADADQGRSLGNRRRRRRESLARVHSVHNTTAASLSTVGASLKTTSAAMEALGRAPGTDAFDPRCHARAHTGYSGDGAVVWGLGKPGFHLADAPTCCRACMAHNDVCGKPGSAGKQWWPGRPDMKCGRDVAAACTIWTFCPEERCFAFDIHKHEFGECWLKFQKSTDPPYTKPRDPHFGHQTYPEEMRHAPRRIWPWAVKEEIWSGPMPKYVPWMSGVIADPSVEIVSSPPSDRWRERWCKKHGPCEGEPY
jgi:hypothetical protein